MSPALRHARTTAFVGSLVVVLLGLSVELAGSAFPGSLVEAWVPLLSLSYEDNLPTWFSSCLLFSCAVVLANIAMGDRTSLRWHWRGLCAGFLLMSFDEMAGLHERLGPLVHLNGVLYFSWVVPAAALVVALGLAYVPFLKRLPPKTRMRFLVAGTIYLTGAVVMELPLGYWAERHGDDNLVYALLDVVEEGLELLGASLFLSALLDVSSSAGATSAES